MAKRKKAVKKVKRKVAKAKRVKTPVKKPIETVVPAPAPEPEGPEPFDVDEWMEEQGLKRGEWETYHKVYDKEFCEVRRKDGTEVSPCWPNAGKFVRLDTAIEVLESDVTHIRYFRPKYKVPHEEDEWGREDNDQDDAEDTDGHGD